MNKQGSKVEFTPTQEGLEIRGFNFLEEFFSG